MADVVSTGYKQTTDGYQPCGHINTDYISIKHAHTHGATRPLPQQTYQEYNVQRPQQDNCAKSTYHHPRKYATDNPVSPSETV